MIPLIAFSKLLEFDCESAKPACQTASHSRVNNFLAKASMVLISSQFFLKVWIYSYQKIHFLSFRPEIEGIIITCCMRKTVLLQFASGEFILKIGKINNFPTSKPFYCATMSDFKRFKRAFQFVVIQNSIMFRVNTMINRTSNILSFEVSTIRKYCSIHTLE